MPLFRASSRQCRPTPFGLGISLEILLPLGASVPRKSTYPRRIPISGLRSAFRVSHPLRGLLLSRPRGFISPRKRLPASPFREFPSRGAVATLRRHSAVLPLLRRLRSRPLGRTGPPAHHAATPRCRAGALGRLHGFYLLESPCRARSAVSTADRSCPSWGFPSPRLSPFER